MDEFAACESTDDRAPTFSRDEKLEVNLLEITTTQLEWFTRECPTFPRLEKVFISDGIQCPQDLCVPCS